MLRGYRWVRYGDGDWGLEGPPKSRNFHGTVRECHDGSALYYLPNGFCVIRTDGPTEEHGCGFRPTVQEAKEAIEAAVKAKKPAA